MPKIAGMEIPGNVNVNVWRDAWMERECITFTIPEQPFLSRAKTFADNTDGIINIDYEEPSTFDAYLHLLYTNQVKLIKNAESDWQSIIDLYELCERLSDDKSLNFVEQDIRRVFGDRCGQSWFIDEIYDKTDSESPLRQPCIEHAVEHGLPSDMLDAEMVQGKKDRVQFLIDVAHKLTRRRRQEGAAVARAE